MVKNSGVYMFEFDIEMHARKQIVPEPLLLYKTLIMI